MESARVVDVVVVRGDAVELQTYGAGVIAVKARAVVPVSEFRAKSSKISMKERDAQIAHMRPKPGGGFKTHQEQADFARDVLQPLRKERNDAWAELRARYATLFGEETAKSMDDDMFVTVTSLAIPRSSDESLSMDADLNLPANCRLDVVFGDVAVFVSTPPARWMLLLQKAGLAHLVEPFRARNLVSPSSWATLAEDDVDVDAMSRTALSDVLAAEGILTDAEVAKLKRRREDVRQLLTSLADAVSSPSATIGDLVVHKKALKTVVSVVDATTLSVQLFTDDDNEESPSQVAIAECAVTKRDVFLSHLQRQAQSSVSNLAILLKNQRVKIWSDQDSVRTEPRDMLRGIENCEYFLIYLTSEYFDSFYCLMEATFAKTANKKLVVVFERDVRHGGGGDYAELVRAATIKFPEFKDWLLSVDAIAMERKSSARRACVKEITQRLGIAPTKQASRSRRGSTAKNETKDAIEALQRAVLDLKMELGDVRSENERLWEALRAA